MSTTIFVLYWDQLFRLICSLPGSIVECGVGRGRSLLIISALNTLYGRSEGGQRDIWAFDSFAGFDEPSVEDASVRNPLKGEWSCSPSGLYEYIPRVCARCLE